MRKILFLLFTTLWVPSLLSGRGSQKFLFEKWMHESSVVVLSLDHPLKSFTENQPLPRSIESESWAIGLRCRHLQSIPNESTSKVTNHPFEEQRPSYAEQFRKLAWDFVFRLSSMKAFVSFWYLEGCFLQWHRHCHSIIYGYVEEAKYRRKAQDQLRKQPSWLEEGERNGSEE